ncbi:MAG: hypothetical protein AAGU77_07430, partial [Bacillota bacterium]
CFLSTRREQPSLIVVKSSPFSLYFLMEVMPCVRHDWIAIVLYDYLSDKQHSKWKSTPYPGAFGVLAMTGILFNETTCEYQHGKARLFYNRS